MITVFFYRKEIDGILKFYGGDFFCIEVKKSTFKN